MLDFKDWKKTKEDSKSVEMTHPKGHSMTILLKGLPGIQKEAIKRLPLSDGGEIKGVHKSAYDSKDKTLMGESEAGKQTKQMDIRKDAKAKAVDEHHKVLGEMKAQPKPKIQGFDEGGDVTSDDSKPPVTVNVNSGPPSPAAQQASTPVNVPQPNIQTQNPSVTLPNQSMSAPGAMATGQQAIQGQSKIDATHAQALIPIEQAKQRAIQLNAQQDQDNINSLRTHAANLDKNIKQIDPQAYVKNMSDPKRVATAIGLFLGGAGVPYGGDNFAGKFLNDSINRDVAAQQQNNENQKTIWGAYNTLYNNENIASNMTKASMAQAYSNQVDQVAAQLGTPQAIVNAQKLKSQLAITGNKGILEASGNLSNTQNMPRGSGNPGQPQTNNQNILRTSTGPQAQNEKPLLPPDDYADNPLLTPETKSTVFGMQQGSPAQRANYPEAFKQYTQAAQADTVLSQLHEVHQQLYKDAQQGGTSGYLRRHDPTATIPFAGHAISQMFVQPATDTQTNRDYDSNKTRVVSDIANALRGTNVSGEAIQRIVDDNTPEHGDTPKMVAQKERNIRVFIKNSVPKTLLGGGK
jgi:hypothetical protein